MAVQPSGLSLKFDGFCALRPKYNCDMSETATALGAALNEIRTFNAVAIIGAGASFQAGMPLAGQLAPLVWQTLDAHPEVKTATGQALGLGAGSAKEIVGHEDWDRIRVAFSKIAADAGARNYFQQSFVRLDR
jgi:hypothetical protein